MNLGEFQFQWFGFLGAASTLRLSLFFLSSVSVFTEFRSSLKNEDQLRDCTVPILRVLLSEASRRLWRKRRLWLLSPFLSIYFLENRKQDVLMGSLPKQCRLTAVQQESYASSRSFEFSKFFDSWRASNSWSECFLRYECSFCICSLLGISGVCRLVEDYIVVYLGSFVFKITRLLVIAVSSVHIFACLFYKVKEVSAASPDDVLSFYTSRDVGEKVI